MSVYIPIPICILPPACAFQKCKVIKNIKEERTTGYVNWRITVQLYIFMIEVVGEIEKLKQ